MNKLAKELVRIAEDISKSTHDFDYYFRWLYDSTMDDGIEVEHYTTSPGGYSVIEMRFGDNYLWDVDVLDGEIDKLQDKGVKKWIRTLKKKCDEPKFGEDWEFCEPKIEPDGTVLLRIRKVVS